MKTKLIAIAILAVLFASPVLAGWVGVLELRASESFTVRCPSGYVVGTRRDYLAASFYGNLIVYCELPAPTATPAPLPTATIPPLQSPLSAPVMVLPGLGTMPTR